MLESVRKEIINALVKAAKIQPHEAAALLETPKSPELGDLAFPCFKLAAKFKTSPQNIAKDIVSKLPKLKSVKKVQVMGPYINFFLSSSNLAENVLTEIYKTKNKFGSGLQKKGNAMVEFSHPNTHKAFHIGHLRNIALGESLARVLENYGYKVIRANYQGDIGPHVAKCLWAYLRYHKGEVPKKDRGLWLGKVYAEGAKKHATSEEVQKEVAELNLKLYAGKDKSLMSLWKKTRQWSLEDFSKIYKELGAKFDELYFESQIEAAGKRIALELLKKGIAKRDQGAIIVDLAPYGLGVCVILTSEGYPLYTTKELGLAEKKLSKYKLDKSIHVVGQEQELFFKQMFKIYELMGSPLAKKDYHLSYGLVILPEGKMSSRLGDVITYHELAEKAKAKAYKEVKKRNPKFKDAKIKQVADKIAIAALKYGMLKQASAKTITFDWEQALEFQGDTGPYLQYSLVRANKILEKVKIKPTAKIAFDLLKTNEEADLIKKIADFKEIVTKAAEQYSPNIIANYAYDLTQVFNSFYEKCPVAKADKKTKAARVLLVWAFAQTLRNALNLLGIEEVEVM